MNPILIAATLGDKIDSTFFGFDIWVFKFFGGIQNGFLTTVAKIFTSFGDENFVIPMAVLAVVLCFFKKTRKLGFSMLFAIAIGTIVTNVIVKPAVLRVRPYNTLQATSAWAEYSKWYIGAGALSESDYSFPSGHTTAAFELAVSVALCLREKGKKKLSWIPPVIAICTMGSRVYLMVHYASDVIGGLIVGTISGVLAFYLAKLACKIFQKVKFLDNIDAEKVVKKIRKFWRQLSSFSSSHLFRRFQAVTSRAVITTQSFHSNTESRRNTTAITRLKQTKRNIPSFKNIKASIFAKSTTSN